MFSPVELCKKKINFNTLQASCTNQMHSRQHWNILATRPKLTSLTSSKVTCRNGCQYFLCFSAACCCIPSFFPPVLFPQFFQNTARIAKLSENYNHCILSNCEYANFACNFALFVNNKLRLLLYLFLWCIVAIVWCINGI